MARVRASRSRPARPRSELDGAPGGTLRSYGILADKLKKGGAEVDLRFWPALWRRKPPVI
ncbi:hypothetical protein [Streptomyces coeruleorubidus]|uniref:hypothetical protein n=1 Tax=Streptomyces coeruleorubidus TaxID=116188 RepID=UPI00379D1435